MGHAAGANPCRRIPRCGRAAAALGDRRSRADCRSVHRSAQCRGESEPLAWRMLRTLPAQGLDARLSSQSLLRKTYLSPFPNRWNKDYKEEYVSYWTLQCQICILETASVAINLERAGSGGLALPSVQVGINVNGEAGPPGVGGWDVFYLIWRPRRPPREPARRFGWAPCLSAGRLEARPVTCR